MTLDDREDERFGDSARDGSHRTCVARRLQNALYTISRGRAFTSRYILLHAYRRRMRVSDVTRFSQHLSLASRVVSASPLSRLPPPGCAGRRMRGWKGDEDRR